VIIESKKEKIQVRVLMSGFMELKKKGMAMCWLSGFPFALYEE